MRVLFTTEEIRDEIQRLMAPGTRRVILAAFVGAGATTYVPKPKGVMIVCWPRAGGTNPHAIRELKRKGAIIRFSDKLHMKLYWARGRGAIIGSANLSTNALGAGGLKELAVLLNSDAVNINELLRTTASHPITVKTLQGLQREHDAIGVRVVGVSKECSFLDWFESPPRTQWKFGWWDIRTPFSQEAKAAAKELNRKPKSSVVGRRDDYKVGDWILSFKLGASVSALDWIYVDGVVKFDAPDSEYPFEAFQARTNRERTTPPFRINRAFRDSFARACRIFGVEKLKKLNSTELPRVLIERTFDFWCRASRKKQRARSMVTRYKHPASLLGCGAK